MSNILQHLKMIIYIHII